MSKSPKRMFAKSDVMSLKLSFYQTMLMSGFMLSCYPSNGDMASSSSNLTACVNSYRNMNEELLARCKYHTFKVHAVTIIG